MDNEALTLSSKVVRNRDQVSAESARRVLMFSVERGEYYALNPVGARIWSLLEHRRTVSEICETIRAEFDVEIEECRQATLSFLNELNDLGLVIVSR